MESISLFRQMMAEQKYYEVQKLVEAKLVLEDNSRIELLKIYSDSLLAQEKTVPTLIAIELIEEELKLKKFQDSLKLITRLNKSEQEKYFLKIGLIKISIFEESGRTSDLYQEISSLLIQLFEKQIPCIPEEVTRLCDKFFKSDFHLNLLLLSFSLLTGNVQDGEIRTRNLIIECLERSTSKGIKEKLNSITELLRSAKDLMPFRMYQNFCELYTDGLTDKKNMKKLIEIVIYFDDFTFQAHILNLFLASGLIKEANTYASIIRKNKNYSFVYFDKYLPSLKKLFVEETKEAPTKSKFTLSATDLKLEDKFISDIVSSDIELEKVEGEDLLKTIIRFQDFSSSQLCDLSVGFIQSEMPEVALIAAKEAMKRAGNDDEVLKGSYLKLNAELMLQDFRAAQDTCLEALNIAETQDDILSFMYGQAEALIRLDDKSQARRVLKKILEIDIKYRLAKERLEKLNEI